MEACGVRQGNTAEYGAWDKSCLPFQRKRHLVFLKIRRVRSPGLFETWLRYSRSASVMRSRLLSSWKLRDTSNVRAALMNEWMTTPAGESVSGARPPRFTRESVQLAEDSLKERIKQVNKDRKSPFRVADAVAFGDFLGERPRVQAADVGINLGRGNEAREFRSAPEAQAEREFLRQLRGRSALLNIKPYVEWMRKRSHLDLH